LTRARAIYSHWRARRDRTRVSKKHSGSRVASPREWGDRRDDEGPGIARLNEIWNVFEDLADAFPSWSSSIATRGQMPGCPVAARNVPTFLFANLLTGLEATRQAPAEHRAKPPEEPENLRTRHADIFRVAALERAAP
jgi:hypothetical protein